MLDRGWGKPSQPRAEEDGKKVRVTIRRITEGGALAMMDRLAEYYIGPGQQYPMRDVPDGVVVHVTIDRVYGQGPWAQGD